MRRAPRHRTSAVACLAWATVLLAGTGLRADESNRGSSSGAPDTTVRRDPAAAETLFDQGRKLLAAGNPRAACPKFLESYRLDPALGSLLNLATCHQLEGKTASAWGEFRDAEQQARRAGDTKRQKFAADHAAALEKGLPKLIVTVVDPPTGLTVSRDGVALGEGSFNTPLPIDPGEHVISAEAPGKKSWQTTILASSGARASVVVPELDRADAPSAEGDPPAGSTPRAARGDSAAGTRTAGIVIGASGLASLAFAGVFASLFFDQASTASDCKDRHCPTTELHPLLVKQDAYGTVCGVTLVVGVVGTVAGSILFLTSSSGAKKPPPASSRWTVLPAAGRDGAGIAAHLRF